MDPAIEAASPDLPRGGSIVIYPESDCLANALQTSISGKTVILETKTFRNQLFPWFEPAHVPKSAQDMGRLLARPGVREKIESLDARYFIEFYTDEEDRKLLPGIFCGAGYGGGGCLGIGSDKYADSVFVSVWDFASGEQNLAVDATATGRSYAVALGLPVAVWADTRNDACRAVARQLTDLLRL
ncbi:MAG: hypothetical protein R3192_03845 [Woeseiaceae bacterium]|nr:hypothetical protein [Woeseiaceae bacterium]